MLTATAPLQQVSINHKWCLETPPFVLRGVQVLCQVPPGSPAAALVKALVDAGVPVTPEITQLLMSQGGREVPPEVLAHVQWLAQQGSRISAVQAVQLGDYDKALKVLGLLNNYSTNQVGSGVGAP